MHFEKFPLQLPPLFVRIVMLCKIGSIYFKVKEVLTMAKCSVCGKSVHFGNKVSHSNRKTRRMWKPNIKSVKVKINGGTRKMPVCTGCLRSGAVERA